MASGYILRNARIAKFSGVGSGSWGGQYRAPDDSSAKPTGATGLVRTYPRTAVWLAAVLVAAFLLATVR